MIIFTVVHLTLLSRLIVCKILNACLMQASSDSFSNTRETISESEHLRKRKSIPGWT